MEQQVRLDKWLWAARFFKTRQLAQQAVNGGKIRLNSHPVKQGRKVKTGDILIIRRGALTQTVEVLICSDRRGAADIAATLYLETPESLAQRARERRLSQTVSNPERARRGRPTRKDRQQLERLLQ
ncbi:MAG: RNA-binding S4 domain-containing protein [Gammaproteobacteria bacterium]|nr:RNA-binding S4 domain-containing protein [Gammaproteobacteria bacterium]